MVPRDELRTEALNIAQGIVDAEGISLYRKRAAHRRKRHQRTARRILRRAAAKAAASAAASTAWRPRPK